MLRRQKKGARSLSINDTRERQLSDSGGISGDVCAKILGARSLRVRRFFKERLEKGDALSHRYALSKLSAFRNKRASECEKSV